MDFSAMYEFVIRMMITMVCLFLCLLTAFLAPCFLGAQILSTVEFWRYFGIAVLVSLLPVATAPPTD